MTTREAINNIFIHLSEQRQNELLDFARYLSWREEQDAWRSIGREQFAKVYGPDEPEYTADDILFNNHP